MDKSLKVLGAKIQGTQKACDDRLKKLMDDQNDIKNHLNALVKKDSDSFLQKDLGDVIYESQISKALFVNTYGSEILTTVLVAVNKTKVEKFRSEYLSFLLKFYETDFDNWKKRTLAQIQAQVANAEDKDQATKQQLIEAEYQKQVEA
jgi:hypothetical protein